MENRSERVVAMITPALLAKAQEFAAARKWSVSSFIEEAITRYIGDHDENIL